jgi:hypothetical protein
MKEHLGKLALVMLLVASTSMCFGQLLKLAPADAIQQQELGNLNPPITGYIHMTNSGANGGTDATGSIVVHVYAFDASDEQLVECCSCRLTPDQGVTLNAVNDLTNNTLTGVRPPSITVKLVASKFTGSSVPNNAATDQRAYGAPGFSAGLRATRLSTHLATSFPTVPGNFVTEVPFSNVTVSDGEYARMIQTCGFIISNGSGFGICNSCRLGTNNAVIQHLTN